MPENAQDQCEDCGSAAHKVTVISCLQSVFTPPLLASALNALRQASYVKPFPLSCRTCDLSEGGPDACCLREEKRMLDALDIIIITLLLSLSLAYVAGCDRLKKGHG